MTEQIVSRATIRARGAGAFNAGRARDSHNMNPGAAAIADWLEGFDQAAQDWHSEQLEGCAFFREQAEVVVAGGVAP